MTAKELVRKHLPRWSEEQAQRALQAAEPDTGGAGGSSAAENGAASTVQAKRPKKKQPKKVGRLSFFAIGAGDPPDASRRVDEFVGRAIDRRHPAS
jgi:hypothetical protein